MDSEETPYRDRCSTFRSLRAGRTALLVTALGLLAACSSPAATPEGTPEEGVIGVTAREYSFDPNTISVPAGTVVFRITNRGNEVHEFEIFDANRNELDEIEDIVPGKTADLSIDLAPGEYEYVCKLNAHDRAGMVGTLTVTAGG